MKPGNLIGTEFNIPCYSAQTQMYKLCEVSKLADAGFFGWELKLTRLPSAFQVPQEIIIQICDVVNFKKGITLVEVGDVSKNQFRLNYIQVNDKDIKTLLQLKHTFRKLGQY